MIMRREIRILAEPAQFDPRHIQKRQMHGITGQRLDRLGHPGRQVGPDPDHDIGLLQRCRLGRAQGMGMRIGAGGQHQLRRAQITHHHRHQRMDRCDIGGDAGHIGQGSGGDKRGARHEGGTERGAVEHDNLLHVTL